MSEQEPHYQRIKKYKRRSERWKKISSGVPLRIRNPGTLELLGMGALAGLLIGLLMGLNIRGIKLWPSKTTVVEYRAPEDMPRTSRTGSEGDEVNAMAREALKKLKQAGYSMEQVRSMYNLSEESLRGMAEEAMEGLPRE